MKKPILLISLLVAVLTVAAQGNNTSMGGDDGDYQSLAERVAKIEKNDMFNVYFNYAASAQLPTASNSASCIASSAINVNE